MTQVIKPTENVFNAVDAVVANGYAAVEGAKSIAVSYCKRVIDALEPYEDISPFISYQNVNNRGYLYLVVDTNRLTSAGEELRMLIEELDRNDPD